MRRALLLLGLASAVAVAAHAASPAGVQNAVGGQWVTAGNGGIVALRPCGSGMCGTVDGITGFQANGDPPVDVHGRSRCHLTIIPDLQLDADGVWGGHVTNPDDGKTYTIQITLDPEGRLRMRGYIGIPLFGLTTVWTRFGGRLTPDCHIVERR